MRGHLVVADSPRSDAALRAVRAGGAAAVLDGGARARRRSCRRTAPRPGRAAPASGWSDSPAADARRWPGPRAPRARLGAADGAGCSERSAGARWRRRARARSRATPRPAPLLRTGGQQRRPRAPSPRRRDGARVRAMRSSVATGLASGSWAHARAGDAVPPRRPRRLAPQHPGRRGACGRRRGRPAAAREDPQVRRDRPAAAGRGRRRHHHRDRSARPRPSPGTASTTSSSPTRCGSTTLSARRLRDLLDTATRDHRPRLRRGCRARPGCCSATGSAAAGPGRGRQRSAPQRGAPPRRRPGRRGGRALRSGRARGVHLPRPQLRARPRWSSAAQDEADGAVRGGRVSLRAGRHRAGGRQRWVHAQPRRRRHRRAHRAPAGRLRVRRRPAVGARDDATRLDRPGLPQHRGQPRGRSARARRRQQGARRRPGAVRHGLGPAAGPPRRPDRPARRAPRRRRPRRRRRCRPSASVVDVVPNHVCAAVNLADDLYVDDKGEVRVWPVAARGQNS